jgi:hypothetical protein
LTSSAFLQVFNVVPSISAVTGISPGRYLWRIVIAFHIGPRILIVSTYYHFLLAFLEKAAEADGGGGGEREKTKEENKTSPLVQLVAKLLKSIYYLQMVEIVGLCGISFIHNREHYGMYYIEQNHKHILR